MRRVNKDVPEGFPNIVLLDDTEQFDLARNVRVIYFSQTEDTALIDLLKCLEHVLRLGHKWLPSHMTKDINDDVDLMTVMSNEKFRPLNKLICESGVQLECFLALLALSEAFRGHRDIADKAMLRAKRLPTEIAAFKFALHQNKRKNVAKKGVRSRQETADELHQKIVRTAIELLANGHAKREISGILANRYQRSARHIRSILKKAEIT